jgi:hypothetical protein
MLTALVLLASTGAPVTASATDPTEQLVRSTDDEPTGDDDTTRPTINEFMPQERALSDCLGALPKPNCGSEARGGWAQTTVFVALLGGLAFIAWRIVAASRRARAASVSTDRTPDATTVPGDDGGAPTP